MKHYYNKVNNIAGLYSIENVQLDLFVDNIKYNPFVAMNDGIDLFNDCKGAVFDATNM